MTTREYESVDKRDQRRVKYQRTKTQSSASAQHHMLMHTDLRQMPHFQIECFLNGMRGIQNSSNHVRDDAPTTAAADISMLAYIDIGANRHYGTDG